MILSGRNLLINAHIGWKINYYCLLLLYLQMIAEVLLNEEWLKYQDIIFSVREEEMKIINIK